MGRSLSGHITSEETKERIREKALGRTPWNKGIKHSKETKQKMSENHPDVSGSNNPMYGKKPGLKNQWGVNNPNWKNGIGVYRQRALKRYGYRCCDCGIEVKELLLVHHIDRDRENNKLKNLEVLCRNCHWLKHKGDNLK